MSVNNATLNGKKHSVVNNFWDIPTRDYTLSTWLLQLANGIQKINAVITHAITPEDAAQNYKLICKGTISYEYIMGSYILTMTFLKQSCYSVPHPEAATNLLQEALQINPIGVRCSLTVDDEYKTLHTYTGPVFQWV